MSKKDFTGFISKSQEQKRSTNLESENQRLREKLEELEKRKEIFSNEIKNIDNNKSQEININEIKIFSNIRQENNFIEELADSIKNHGQLQPVLLTKDKYLIAGHRRYKAKKFLKDEKILVCYIEKNLEDIIDIFDLLQYQENEERKNLDNFEISLLFKKYLDKGYSQKDISELFKKTKGYISAILKISDMDKKLIEFCKEIQIYGMSYKKFTIVNSEKKEDSKHDISYNNPVILGWNTLYNIAKNNNLDEQKKVFLKNFRSKLSNEEIENYFEHSKAEKKNISTNKILKQSRTINSSVKKIMKNYTSNESISLGKKIDQNLKEFEKLINELSNLS
ncbi:MAG: ParB/RepB/Spo0J family partition protein [Candidatus Sericytochromatia bacterium]